MTYFKELPNIQYIGDLPQTSNVDYILAKNIFKRVKLREDFKNIFTYLDLYFVKDNERPDQVATRVYNDPNLDWIVLVANNITNIVNEWPLNSTSFYEYLLDKYGSEENFNNIHHYETEQKIDEYNRLVIPSGLKVDPPLNVSIVTGIGVSEYQLPNFLNDRSSSSITVNLNQSLNVGIRTTESNDQNKINIIITENKINYSYFSIPTRSTPIKIEIANDLDNWPGGWGGSINVLKRGINSKIPVNDIIYNNDIEIPQNLYEIGYSVNVGPIFRLIKK